MCFFNTIYQKNQGENGRLRIFGILIKTVFRSPENIYPTLGIKNAVNFDLDLNGDIPRGNIKCVPCDALLPVQKVTEIREVEDLLNVFMYCQ